MEPLLSTSGGDQQSEVRCRTSLRVTMKEEDLTDLGKCVSELLQFFWAHWCGGGHVGAERSGQKDSEPGSEKKKNQEVKVVL